MGASGKGAPTALNGLEVSYNATRNHTIYSLAGREVYCVDAFGNIRPHVYVDCKGMDTVDQLIAIQSDGTAFDGTGDVLNYLYMPGGVIFGCEAIATQTIVPDIVANGLDIAGDQTANDGYELWTNFLGATGVPFVVGRDPAFYARCKFQMSDVSGTDDFQFGFRRAEICRPAFDDYLDAFTLGCNTAADPMAIKIATIVNNAATVETDTTDTLADATEVDFKVLVSAAGVVTYTINGAAPTATAAVTIDDGDPVIPFIRFLQDTALVDDFTISEWEVGFQ